MAFSNMFSGTDGVVSISGLSLNDGTIITGATVTGVLNDSNGVVVSTWSNVSFQDEGGGTYSHAYAATSVPSVGTYQIVITALKSGLTLTVYHDIVVQHEIL